MPNRFTKLCAAVGRRERLVYYAALTALFLLTAGVLSIWFAALGKAPVSTEDGINYNFSQFIYLGDYLRRAWRAFWTGGPAAVPVWDFSIGMGSGPLQYLAFSSADPLNILSAFFPPERAVIPYAAAILTRVYLMGVGFSALCHKLGSGRFACLCGALAYMFCFYNIRLALRQPMFIVPFMYLPFILLGIEKLYAGEKPYTFIFSIFFLAFSNFLGAYMISILIFIYAAVRFFALVRENRLRGLFHWLGKFGGYYAVGILLAGVIFVPSVLISLTSGRLGSGPALLPLFPLSYYETLVKSFAGMQDNSYLANIGGAPIAFIAVLLLFFQRGKHTGIKIGFALVVLFLLFPVFPYIFSGFVLLYHRWCLAAAFVTSLALTVLTPKLLNLTRRDLTALSGALLIYLALCLLGYNGMTTPFLVSVVTLFGSFLGLCLISKAGESGAAPSRNRKYAALLSIVLLGVLLPAWKYYSPFGSNYVGHMFEDADAPRNALTAYSSHIFSQRIQDGSFWRYEDSGTNIGHANLAPVLDVNSMGAYQNLLNPHVTAWMMETGNAAQSSRLAYSGLDGRAWLEALAGVKYFAVKTGQEGYLPYGFDRVAYRDEESGLTIYENGYALPLGYTARSCIPAGEYRALPPAQKQQALLQGAVTDQMPEGLPQTRLAFTDETLKCAASYDDNVSLIDGGLHVKKPGAKMTLTFPEQTGREMYVHLENIVYNGGFSPKASLAKGDIALMQRKDRLSVELREKYWSPADSASVNAFSSGISKSVAIRTPRQPYYFGKHDFLIHLMYSETGRSEIVLTFSHPGIYTFDAIQVISQPMDGYPGMIGQLKEDVLEDVTISGGTVSGVLDLDAQKLLCLSIPFDVGWSAQVDGADAELLRVNTAFTGLLLPPGRHTVTLRYQTPYQKLGIASSCLGLAALACVAAFQRRGPNLKRAPEKVLNS